MERPEGYPEVLQATTETDSGASFPGSKVNDMSQLESGLLRRNYSDVGGNKPSNYYRFRSNVIGKSIDPKLLALVEFFRELYFRRIELFEKTLPASTPADRSNFLVEMPKKLNLVLSQVKGDEASRIKTMQRSLSIGSPREFTSDEKEMRLERFKIRTIDVDDDDDNDDKTKPGGSK